MKYKTAQEAFDSLYDMILDQGEQSKNTRFLQNIGFYIKEPLNNEINLSWRKWKKEYAEIEWQWYLSAVNDVSEIKKHAKIWDKMHNGDNKVNSNYGFQWSRNNQLQFVIDELNRDENSRRAVLSIYDGKEHEKHSFDTPCTLNIVFNITHGKLNMSVLMRSNDLWFGFCNDQYCFSKLHELVASRLKKQVGWYYHFANNMHLYEQHLNKK
jgi:thymidylate synthase